MEEKEKNEKGLQKVNAYSPYPYPPPYYVPCDDDEIDLYELWLILKKRKKLIFYTLGAFLLFAILYLAIASPKYGSSAVYSWSNISISSDTLSVAITNLNNALKEENYQLLEKTLKLSPSELKKVVSIEVVNDRRSKDKNLLKTSFVVNDKKLIIPLASNLQSALNNLPAVKEALKIKKETLETQIKTNLEQIKQLEKLKEGLLNKIEKLKDPQLVSAVTSQLVNVNQQILDKEASIEYARLQLKNLKGIEIAVPPIVPKKPYSPKASLIIAIAIVSGIFTGMFLAFLAEWLENVRRKHEGENS
jgi:uncharacterized protein involved in exopolysaccharide biosynthesis